MMLKYFTILFFSIWATCPEADAQADSSEEIESSEYHRGTLLEEKGTQEKGKIPVHHDLLPTVLKETLSQNKDYQGWKYALIYFDKGTKLYEVFINDAKGSRTYRFDQKGNPVKGNMRPRN